MRYGNPAEQNACRTPQHPFVDALAFMRGHVGGKILLIPLPIPNPIPRLHTFSGSVCGDYHPPIHCQFLQLLQQVGFPLSLPWARQSHWLGNYCQLHRWPFKLWLRLKPALELRDQGPTCCTTYCAPPSTLQNEHPQRPNSDLRSLTFADITFTRFTCAFSPAHKTSPCVHCMESSGSSSCSWLVSVCVLSP